MEDLEDRLLALERHFVTKRDETGKILETLADRRKRGAQPPSRVKWQQMRRWLEETDGGRKQYAHSKDRQKARQPCR
jgi:hypothetical protein